MTANTSIETMLDNLENLRLPELQACFKEVVGKATRAPNRKFLLRKIREAAAQREPAQPNPAQTNPAKSPTILTGPLGPVTVQARPAQKATAKAPAARPPKAAQGEPTAPSPAALDRLTARKKRTKPARAKKTNVIKKAPIRVAPRSDLEAMIEPEAARVATEGEVESTAAPPRPELKPMSVNDLRAAYLEEVGRGTKSTDRNYLIWKIRQAREGKVPVGPISRTRSDTGGARRVLPLRMHDDTIEALDEAWRRHGLGSRMDLFRAALTLYFTDLEEHQTAALVRR